MLLDFLPEPADNSWCLDNVHEDRVCEQLAKEGHCSGTNVKFALWQSTKINFTHYQQTRGFHPKEHSINIEQ